MGGRGRRGFKNISSLRVHMAIKILGDFEVFVGIFEETKEKKDRALRRPESLAVRITDRAVLNPDLPFFSGKSKILVFCSV